MFLAEVTSTANFDLITFIREFGFPTFVCLYLLLSFQKKLDKLIIVVNRLTGIILTMSKQDNTSFPGGDDA